MMALHFVGFRDPRYWKAEPSYMRAVAIFGEPDFCHRVWDMRAMADIAPGDKVVWHNSAKGLGECMPPYMHYTFDDSRQDIVANGGEPNVDYIP